MASPPKSLHAGLDWSGRAALASRQPDIFIACLVGVENVERLRIRFEALRLETFGDKDAELHGYRMPPERIATTLQIGLELEMKVAALCIDKTASAQTGTLPDTHQLHTLAALRACNDFLIKNPISRLVYDTELEGKARQQRFESEVKRRSAAFHPTQKIKVKPLPSHKSDLIQLADVVAYALSRQLRNEKVEPKIRELLRQIALQNEAVGQRAQRW